WTREHQKAFLDVKIALTSSPVFRSPVYDNRPFIVTTDGCKDSFAGALSQWQTTVLPDGTEVTRLH
ncbi:hypothetical protein BV25DRAFT_1774371, partial [Artomyces pyxidatus]